MRPFNHIVTITIFLSITIISSRAFTTSKTARSIIDYYNLIPQKFFSIEKWPLRIHKLESGEIIWYVRDPSAKSNPEREGLWPRWGNYTIIVDPINGFIEFPFFGSIFRVQQLALFIGSSRNEYLGLSYFFGAPFGPLKSSLIFLRLKYKEWKDVTPKLFSETILLRFFKKQIPYSRIQMIKKIISPYSLFIYTLPRHGTTVEIKINKDFVERILRYKKILNPSGGWILLEQKQMHDLQNFLNVIRKERIFVSWDVNQERFL